MWTFETYLEKSISISVIKQMLSVFLSQKELTKVRFINLYNQIKVIVLMHVDNDQVWFRMFKHVYVVPHVLMTHLPCCHLCKKSHQNHILAIFT